MDRLERRWTFLTHHARVLTAIARNPTTRLRDIAAACQITTAQAIVADLDQAGHLRRQRLGRRKYTLNLDQPSPPHPADAALTARAPIQFAAIYTDPHQADTQLPP